MEEKQTTQKQNEKERKIGMGILSYLGPLVIIPLVTAREDSFVKFHIKQGLVLLISAVIVSAISGVFAPFAFIINLANLGIFVLAIIGIVNVFAMSEKEVPFLGHYAKYFTF